MSTPLIARSLTFGELLGTWGKAITGLLVVGLTAYSAALPDGITLAEGLGIASQTVAATAAIWAVPKAPAVLANYGKPVTGAIVAALGALATAAIIGSIGQQDIVHAVLAALLTLGGVAAISNSAASDPVVQDPATGKYVIVPLPAEVKERVVAEGMAEDADYSGETSETFEDDSLVEDQVLRAPIAPIGDTGAEARIILPVSDDKPESH